ncbi:ACP S-malonyltransferase [Teredinibacter turnerae]|uniref:Malonyl CoA-acyl carrier protein transacylase n=1 Tax=Teredinibacter turnerae (strain ATCC 39867 / T7901) TaxID=377629 RepID=C5BU57_TERTT|nr:ACP S-malonyltransferase [Teredinibacter turnerae]ACR12744.1 malonyl CoA-acyl carrier protein transacylase [Teredinibacter turnerae T7901]
MSNSKLAFVFPGQGSQKVGMLGDLAESYTVVKDTFAQASEALGYDLWKLVQEGPQEELNMTEVTQPALLTASVATWRVWQEKGGAKPEMMAGHSLGEWSALVCAGIVDFTDAVKLVRMRGQFMQEAVPAGIGAMAAIIGLDDSLVEEACTAAMAAEASNAQDIVSPVNYNSPGQLVIAGHAAAVERAMALCKDAGAKRALLLPVSAPFHTALMKPAADRLAEHIQSTAFESPSIPVVHNVTAQTLTDAEEIKAIMVAQIYSAVRWVACVNALTSAGIGTTVECGPGKVLSGLNKRIDRALNTLSTDSEDALSATLLALPEAGE